MIAALGLLTLLAYAAVWSAPFVYDDANWVSQPMPWTWPYWARAPWILAQHLGGGLPWAFHGVVLGLHLVNGLLLWLLARRWLSEVACLLVLALWWLHPIQVEAVAYVSGGIEVLLTTYVLIAALGLLSPSWILPLIGAVSLGLAATLKLSALPVLVAVPLVVLIGRGVSGWLPIAAAAAVVGACAWRETASAFLWRSVSLASRLDALAVVARALVRDLALLVWPVGFSIEHPAGGSLLALLALAVGVALAVAIRSRWPAPAWACAWLAILLLPRALVPHFASPLTEHHLYLPDLAIWLTAGSAVDRFTLAS